MQPGDQVLCVNGHNLLDQSNSEAMIVLKSALAQIKPGTNSIQLVIYIATNGVQNNKGIDFHGINFHGIQICVDLMGLLIYKSLNFCYIVSKL